MLSARKAPSMEGRGGTRGPDTWRTARTPRVPEGVCVAAPEGAP
uniref:Uncharacterized protein n=1 Tax=Arundo donax TaxID=35708 RepID=A0A0A9AEF0_ARUDO